MIAHTEVAMAVGAALIEREQFVSVAESSAGGLISATLLSVPGASAFYLGGAVVYTSRSRGLIFEKDELPPETRGATEDFAQRLALGAKTKMRSDWGLAETGATGPSGNPYGDPAGHAWVCVARPDGSTEARNVLTGSADRAANMSAFTEAALQLLLSTLTT
ncbi:MAG: nicotinamide-nucleotide amidase [Acidimicrobiales bacterium]|jgi:nicotinamide-nucleotide amidase